MSWSHLWELGLDELGSRVMWAIQGENLGTSLDRLDWFYGLRYRWVQDRARVAARRDRVILEKLADR